MSSKTDKSFIGKVENNRFRIISSEIGKGALCVLSGQILNGSGSVKVELNRPFKILFSVFYILPIGGMISEISKAPDKFVLFLIVGVLQLLMIRFFFIEIFFFRRFARRSLDRLGDVLDVEWMHKV